MTTIHSSIPAGHTGPTVYLLNFPAAHTPHRRYAVSTIASSELRDMLEGPHPIVSALGHQGAADSFAGLLGVEVPMSRIEISFKPGDIALCCKLNQRLPEGAILTREAMEEIGYTLIRVDVFLGDLETEIASRWVSAMRAMGADLLRGAVWEGRHEGVGVSPGDSMHLHALGAHGSLGSIYVDTDECPLSVERVSWRAVRDAWEASGGTVLQPGTWEPRPGERVRAVLDGESIRGTALTASSAAHRLGKGLPVGWEHNGAEIVILPDNYREFVSRRRVSALRPGA